MIEMERTLKTKLPYYGSERDENFVFIADQILNRFLRVAPNIFFFESSILAQDERWRRG